MEIMTVKEVANFLKVNPKTVYNWRDRKKAFREASFKLEDEVRFYKHKLEEWLSSLAS